MAWPSCQGGSATHLASQVGVSVGRARLSAAPPFKGEGCFCPSLTHPLACPIPLHPLWTSSLFDCSPPPSVLCTLIPPPSATSLACLPSPSALRPLHPDQYGLLLVSGRLPPCHEERAEGRELTGCHRIGRECNPVATRGERGHVSGELGCQTVSDLDGSNRRPDPSLLSRLSGRCMN